MEEESALLWWSRGHLALEENQELITRKYKACLEVGLLGTKPDPSYIIYHILSKQREQIKISAKSLMN